MSRLYDHKSKQWIDVDDSQVDDKVLSGNYTFGQGLDVPVVSPDGQLGSIPSDQAYEAFKAGYRWSTPVDRANFEQRRSEEIKKERFGDETLTAMGLGAARAATLGGSDIALRAAGLGEEVSAVKELNPISSAVGAVAGLAATLPLGGAIGAAAKGGVTAAKFGAGLGESVAAATGITRAAEAGGLVAKAVQTALPVITGSAIEGAYYGLGEGISEAALGRPEDVVENIALNVGLGGLYGGAFGSVIGGGKAAAPFAKSIASYAAGKFDQVVQSAARKTASGTVRAVLNLKGEKDLGKLLGHLAGTEEGAQIRRLFEEGNLEAAEKAIKEIGAGEKALSKVEQRTRRELTEYLKAQTAGEQKAVTRALQKTGGNVDAAKQELYAEYQAMSDTQKATMQETLTGPARQIDDILGVTRQTIADLKRSGNSTAKERAAALEEFLKTRLAGTDKEVIKAARLSKKAAAPAPTVETAAPFTLDKAVYKPAVRAVEDLKISGHPAAEARIAAIRKAMQGGSLNDDERAIMKAAINNVRKTQNAGEARAAALSDILEKNPAPSIAAEAVSEVVAAPAVKRPLSEFEEIMLVKDLRRELDYGKIGQMKSESGGAAVKAGYSNLGRFLTEHPNADVAKSFQEMHPIYEAYQGLGRLLGKKATKAQRLLDPDIANGADELFTKLAEFAPEFSQYVGAGKNAIKKKAALQAIQQKFIDVKAAESGVLSLGEIEEILGTLGMTKDAATKLGKLKDLAAEGDAIRNLNPLEKAIRIKKALGLPVDKTLQDILPYQEYFQAMSHAKALGGGGADTMGTMIKDHISRKATAVVAGTVLGGPAGGAVAYAGKTAFDIASNPYQTMRALTFIEKLSNKGSKAVAKWAGSIVDGLTGERVRRAGVRYEGSKPKDYKERREDFKHQQAYLQSMVHPENAHTELTASVTAIPGAPKIQQAMYNQLQKTAAFLNTKLPQNPRAGQSILGVKDNWAPSDTELSKFHRYLHAAVNPQAVMEAIEKGSVAPEEIETLRALYPSIYGQVQAAVVDALTNSEKQLSYKARKSLYTLFGVPTDYSFTPQAIANFQMTFATPEAGRPEGAKTRNIKIDIDPMETVATETQRLREK